jgi:hypothetical protein
VNLDNVNRFRTSDICYKDLTGPLSKLIGGVNPSRFNENYRGVVTVLSNYKEDVSSSGTIIDVVPDLSKSYVHAHSNYYSVGGWCGAIVTIDQATVCGLHYHTDGKGDGNNFYPFTSELFDFLTKN